VGSQCDGGGLDLFEIDLEGPDQGGFSEEVGAVIHAVELVELLDDLAVLVLLDVLLDFDSELEAEVVKPFEFILFPHELMEAFPFNFDVRHLLMDLNMKEIPIIIN
jgi:hypothetical protein